MTKKTWDAPSLKTLDVTRTLGGFFTNLTENDFGIPNNGGPVVTPLGCQPDCLS